jgi:hypothetical protein
LGNEPDEAEVTDDVEFAADDAVVVAVAFRLIGVLGQQGY